jgi:pimeloyl-ACP methyl ester carboxylesterase
MGYVGRTAPVTSWAEAAAYARATNGVAFPNNSDADWDAFARRIFREGFDGPELDYDPAITAPFKAAPTGPAPDLWPVFAGLASGRPSLLVRGAISDLVDRDIAARMRLAAPTMEYAEVADVGHAPMLNEPEAQAALAAFLDAAP